MKKGESFWLVVGEDKRTNKPKLGWATVVNVIKNSDDKIIGYQLTAEGSAIACSVETLKKLKFVNK